ncbi:hypothetical protein BJV82DRAFT_269962 [Fennellomyces sp. T-0311]|nr:hypothetical protein BJV82DRAFT_269962 [Fennellomyces sp. T-0311]
MADEILEYARVQVEQVILVHVNLADDITFTAFDEAWDQVCKVHSDRTEGTNVYEAGECPFVFKKEGGPWSSLGELVNYDPEMAQWEGDGEVVGVRSKIILTTSRKSIHNSAYFSEKFWRSSPVQNAPDIDQQLHHLCKTSGGVGLEAYVDPSYDNVKDMTFDAAFWENAIASACDINNADACVNMIEVDQYHYYLDYLYELQKRMVPVNFGRWQGQKVKLETSKIVKKERERDEL